MGKNDRDVVARRELTHALEALGDGIGHETWGPGPVIERLSKRQFDYPGVGMAVEALEAATMATHDLLHRTKRDDALIAIRRLAPVFLELIIEHDARDGVKRGLSKFLPSSRVAISNAELLKNAAWEPPGSITSEYARAAEITRDLFINTAPVVNLPLDNARWKELVEAARIELGVPLPLQKLVDDAKFAQSAKPLVVSERLNRLADDAAVEGCGCFQCTAVRAQIWADAGY